MGLINRLLGSIGGGDSGPSCPTCGTTLESDGTYGQGFECPSCVDGVVHRIESGRLNSYPRSGGGGGPTCQWCSASLKGGQSYMPYEDGSNSQAYIICPSCQQENIQYGFGDEDD